MSPKFVIGAFLCFVLVLITAQDIQPNIPPPVSENTPETLPEETTPGPTKTPLWPHDTPGNPDYEKHLFTWFEYKKFSNGKCFSCRCLQLRHYKETCECFNDFLHAKSNFARGLYIKKSPWYRCKKATTGRYNYEKRSDNLI